MGIEAKKCILSGELLEKISPLFLTFFFLVSRGFSVTGSLLLPPLPLHGILRLGKWCWYLSLFVLFIPFFVYAFS